LKNRGANWFVQLQGGSAHGQCLACLALIGILAGCAVGPNYQRPPVEVPASFRGASSVVSSNALAELPWWQVFKDPRLVELLGIAITNNYDVRAAAARVEQARAVAAQNRALFFPQVNYLGFAGRAKNATAAGATFENGQIGSTYAIDGLASWEIDIWGRIRRLNESARAQFLATEQAQRAVALSVLSDVAQAYFRLLALDAQVEIARRTTNSFGESLRIFSQRLEQGVVSKLETAAAQAALSSAAASVPDLERQIVAQENLLNLLLGRNPDTIARRAALLSEQLELSVPPGLPSDLLRRRPDLLQAEESLKSANALVGVAVADFFPQLSLTALFGKVSPELSLFTSGTANAWSAAATVTGPLFQGGRLVGQYRQAKAMREEAQLQYQQRILNAFQEVSDDLVAVEKLGEARVEQSKAVQAYQVAVQVSLERYVAGRASYYEVLQEQQLLFPAENALVQIEVNQLLSFVQLYQALGGGFSPQDTVK
jgi:multidrug efflux system outer membrane protein